METIELFYRCANCGKEFKETVLSDSGWAYGVSAKIRHYSLMPHKCETQPVIEFDGYEGFAEFGIGHLVRFKRVKP